jgi:hypothetical protein
MQNELIDKQVRDDLISGGENENKALNALLIGFNKFVKDNVKRGDFDEFKDINKKDYGKDVGVDEYILNLAEIFLEPVLPLDINNPDRFNFLFGKLAVLYKKDYMV